MCEGMPSSIVLSKISKKVFLLEKNIDVIGLCFDV